jgi:hypothetical protein
MFLAFKIVLSSFLCLYLTLLWASSDNWLHVVDQGGNTVFYDTKSVSNSDGILSVRWVSNSANGSRLRFGSGYLNKKSILYSSRFECKSKSFIVDRAVWFDSEFALGQGHTTASTGMGWQNPESRHYEKNLNVRVLTKLCK